MPFLLADPDHGQALGVLRLVLHDGELLGRRRLDHRPQLLVQL